MRSWGTKVSSQGSRKPGPKEYGTGPAYLLPYQGALPTKSGFQVGSLKEPPIQGKLQASVRLRVRNAWMQVEQECCYIGNCAQTQVGCLLIP